MVLDKGAGPHMNYNHKTEDDDHLFQIVGSAFTTELVNLPGRSKPEKVQVHQVNGPQIELANGGTSFLLWEDCAFGHKLQTDLGTVKKSWRKRGYNEQGIMLEIAAKRNLQTRELREAGVLGHHHHPELPDYLGGSKPVMKLWQATKDADAERMEAVKAKLFAGPSKK
uniref:Uncharacterized protein n=1 Tax=Alexandrium andersonii TaxID=327968 RepID=A0A7S2HL69_9DINO|mmetsp:Transcript_72762/g.162901  ORF Transcript_72762/g.162901 Transcript_72762/m.162901 type:complete len:168 (+) Transcript_72762:89-592(+)